MVSEGQCWNNFLRAHLEAFQSPTLDGINDVLKQYGASVPGTNAYEVEFDSEKDKAFFVLKYS
jgi:inhibitor of KinA sporulation pathway (predicted exonuclease)